MALTAKLHTNREYERELQSVRDNLLKMTGFVEQMITDSVKSLLSNDSKLAAKTIETDHEVNRLEIETDDLCLLILARRQPLASDLRFITLAMKMVTDLERIGDLTVNICERTIVIDKTPPPRTGETILEMGELVKTMIHRAIDAFVTNDVGKAEQVWDEDEAVDAAYIDLCKDVQGNMREDPEWVERGIHLQAVAKFLERIGDHCTNLAEQVVFLVKGKDIRHIGKR
ncbi:MAG: phosphate signaling complex protein PhoU [Deltaproteobacteria bacterium]|jgi:phosphate transport system protein|nr:phosphate signaling complex protein PhoU [Deltaproteobacteria bacterium]